MKDIKICVYGAASENIDSHFIDKVEELGRGIARRGHSLVYGAGSSGLMGAVARGVTSAHGTVIGVVPYFMEHYEGLYQDCTELIKTETMSGRKAIMEEKADAFVIVPGGIGTMDEFFQILTLVELNRKSAPIVVFNIAGFYNSIFNYIDLGIEKGFIREKVRDLFSVQDTAGDVLDAIEEVLN